MHYIQKTAEEASDDRFDLATQCGEGWLLTGEMIGADAQRWREQYRLSAAVRLPAESCDRQGYDESHSGSAIRRQIS